MKFALIFTVLSLSAAPCRSLPLSEALKQARSHAAELRESSHKQKQAEAQTEAVEGSFDTTVTGRYATTKDKSKQTSTFAGDERESQTASLGVRRLFGSGTTLSATASYERSETEFEETQSTDASATQSTSQSSSSLTYNPSYTMGYQVEVSQELWKNFWANQVRLQKAVAALGILSPEYNRKIAEQSIQLETETLYWQLAALAEQVKVAEALVKKANEFAKQMARRVKLGRADSVDEADADAAKVAQESSFLEIETNLNKLKRQYAFRLHPDGGSSDFSTDALTSRPLALPATTPDEAATLAIKQRHDLAMLRAQRQGLQAKNDLAAEQGKPSVALFGNYSQTGLDDNFSDANKEASKGKTPTLTLGLRLEVPVGRTKSAQEVIAAVEESKALSAHEAGIVRDIKRDIAVAYDELAGANKQLKLAESKIKSFERKRRQESVKLKQARSDRVTVIRYEMEVLSAKNERLAALRRRHDAEAQIRFLLHAYPSEL